MYSFIVVEKFIAQAYTGGAVKCILAAAKLTAPADVTGMYLRGEQPAYIQAACLAIDQIGN